VKGETKSGLIGVGAALLLLTTSALHAQQAFPTRPVRLICPFAAGSSSNDILTRQLAQRMSALLGQQFVVDNRPGASGHIGAELVARAAPDGYTLLVGTNGTLATSVTANVKLGYDPTRDFAPVARFAIVPYAFTVNSALPVNNIKEFIAYAKARPGKLHFASSGTGNTPHLCGELLRLNAGIDMVHVPYKGGAPAVVDLLAGHVQLYCGGVTSVLSQVKTGKLRIIGVTTLTRAQGVPDLPTVHEQGVTGFDVSSWIALMAPAKTPPAIIQRLYETVARATNEPEMRASIIAQGSEPAVLPPQALAAYINTEIVKWAKVIKAAGIQPQN
jgi:tripartite-type tricarboxylate transporter receptor subunit TctC